MLAVGFTSGTVKLFDTETGNIISAFSLWDADAKQDLHRTCTCLKWVEEATVCDVDLELVLKPSSIYEHLNPLSAIPNAHRASSGCVSSPIIPTSRYSCTLS